MIFYFSGTGNSYYIASVLAKHTSERMISVSEAWKEQQWEYSLQEGERIGFVFPVYSWAPPKLFLDVISNLVIRGTVTYCYMVCTCGDDIGCTLSIMQKTLERKGWVLNCGFSVIMPNTYVCLPGFDVDSQLVIQTKMAALPERLEQVVVCVQEKKSNCWDVHPGSFPWIKSHLIHPLFNRFLLTDRYFRSSDSCNGCTKCSRECPVGNILMKDRRPQWQGHCVGCLRCYHTCPQHAIDFAGQTKRKGQYLYRQSLSDAQ